MAWDPRQHRKMELRNGREILTASFSYLLPELYSGLFSNSSQESRCFLWPVQIECLLLAIERILITSVFLCPKWIRFSLSSWCFLFLSSLQTKPIFQGLPSNLLSLWAVPNSFPYPPPLPMNHCIQVVPYTPLRCYQFSCLSLSHYPSLLGWHSSAFRQTKKNWDALVRCSYSTIQPPFMDLINISMARSTQHGVWF